MIASKLFLIEVIKMLGKIFDNPTSLLLNKSMDTATLRNSVIADNIANVDTPNFKRREVLFQEKLQNTLNNNKSLDMRVTNNRHILMESKNNLEPEIRQTREISYRNDGNNVDIDVESALMAKNKLHYDALAQTMDKEIKLLRLAITGRG